MIILQTPDDYYDVLSTNLYKTTLNDLYGLENEEENWLLRKNNKENEDDTEPRN